MVQRERKEIVNVCGWVFEREKERGANTCFRACCRWLGHKF